MATCSGKHNRIPVYMQYLVRLLVVLMKLILMGKFIIRVQFSIEDQRRYTLLRDSLLNLKVGFTKRIKSIEGIEYRLPNGNYYIECDNTPKEVLNTVRNIANQIDKSPMILVTDVKDKGWAWVGLERC